MTAELETLSTTPPILEVTLSQEITAEDYRKHRPFIDSFIESHGKLRLLLHLVGDIRWQPKAIWEDIKFDFKHALDLDRIAVVGDRRWEQGMATLYKLFSSADTRYFPPREIEDARKWLRSARSRSAEQKMTEDKSAQ